MPGLGLSVWYTLPHSVTKNSLKETLTISPRGSQETDLDSDIPGQERGTPQDGGGEGKKGTFCLRMGGLGVGRKERIRKGEGR